MIVSRLCIAILRGVLRASEIGDGSSDLGWLCIWWQEVVFLDSG